MKMSPLSSLAALALALPAAYGQGSGVSFTNFVRQVQLPSGVEQNMDVAPVSPTGGALSPLAIDPGGARFELWTVKNTNPPTSYLLDSKYVGTYVPIAQVRIETGDPYPDIPRTRADQPFKVHVTMSELLLDPNAPEASRMVDFFHHVQTYGTKGDGVNIDRTQATLEGSLVINQNGIHTYSYTVNQVPGANRAKVRGEERFSVFSLPDYQSPASQLASQFIQVWPVSDGSISGIQNGQLIEFKVPDITISLNDLYPGSSTYTQVYKGPPALGTNGITVPGGAWNNTKAVPEDKILPVSDYDAVFDEGGDGQWTMEVITSTPFGLDRLAYVTFYLDRTIEFIRAGFDRSG